MTYDGFIAGLFNLLYFPYYVPVGLLITSTAVAVWAERGRGDFVERGGVDALTRPWLFVSLLQLAGHLYLFTYQAGLGEFTFLAYTLTFVVVQDAVVLLAIVTAVRARRDFLTARVEQTY